MRSIIDQKQEIELRAGRLRRKQRRRERAALSFLSAVLLLLPVLWLPAVREAEPIRYGGTQYGSILLYQNAGGYVLAGFLAFFAGVIVAFICMHCRDRKDQDKKGN